MMRSDFQLLVKIKKKLHLKTSLGHTAKIRREKVINSIPTTITKEEKERVALKIGRINIRRFGEKRIRVKMIKKIKSLVKLMRSGRCIRMRRPKNVKLNTNRDSIKDQITIGRIRRVLILLEIKNQTTQIASPSTKT